MHYIIKHWYELIKDAAGTITSIGRLRCSHRPGNIVMDAHGQRKYRVQTDGSIGRV